MESSNANQSACMLKPQHFCFLILEGYVRVSEKKKECKPGFRAALLAETSLQEARASNLHDKTENLSPSAGTIPASK